MQPDVLETLILVVHVLASLAIIGLILIQQGKGAEMGSGFGGGASGTVFGSGGAGNFLTKATTSIAIAFFLTSFALAFYAKEKSVAARTLGIPQVEQAIVEPQLELPSLPDGAGSIESELPALDAESEQAVESEVPKG